MRITDNQYAAIKAAFATNFLSNDSLWLFGSRIDDSKKGGDIDFYIETHYDNTLLATEKKLAFLRDLKKRIGDQKIDVVVNILKNNKQLEIYEEAKQSGIIL